MMPVNFERWLTTTVPGIIVLGAFGSILAVIVLTLLKRVTVGLGRRIKSTHQKVFAKQAYIEGYSAAIIEHDETGRWIVSLMIYRAVRVLLAAIFAAACLISFLVVVLTSEVVVLSFATYLPVLIGFLSIYWFYYEYEFLYRMYWTYWRAPFEHAAESYKTRAEGKQLNETESHSVEVETPKTIQASEKPSVSELPNKGSDHTGKTTPNPHAAPDANRAKRNRRR